ncbi:hypothetical protein [Mastigocladopsis repens]|uniref:hypothetical protein n=1 Tax=Mastigocladopsis repens TaxID=221287 RepID=UPI001E439D3D|nr:hypothetical protein [Mastigocladopsis repens]
MEAYIPRLQHHMAGLCGDAIAILRAMSMTSRFASTQLFRHLQKLIVRCLQPL